MTTTNSSDNTSSYIELDALVGAVAGSICNTLLNSPLIHQNQFVLLPAVTLKVKTCLIRAESSGKWTESELPEIAKDMRSSIIPLMWALDFPSDAIYKLGPEIEKSALEALRLAA